MSAAAHTSLSPEALEHVASYFRVLSQAARLRILNVLCAGEMSVGDIAQQVDSSVANTSRHLAQMAAQGLVARESRGNSAYYRIADPTVHALCELVCASVARRLVSQASAHAAPVAPGAGGAA
ncbi:MAG: metalloregulator ArsR/SmtB family transcription factor [Pseudomonadota bacterium]|nr:metalloregulator ArsR/SmtB family transcription factor [Pseudomonadota bacterium]